MTTTNISYKGEARARLKNGVDTLADAVKVTLGAKGRNVAIAREPGRPPHITKDGVTVANSIKQLADPMEDMGAQAIKEASRKTMEKAGDGTTTSTVLAQAIISKGIEAIDAGANPMDLKNGIDAAVSEVVDFLRSKAQKIDDKNKMLHSIALQSSNNDKKIADMVVEAITAVGADGIVNIEENNITEESYVRRVEGLILDRGYISQHFVNDAAKMRVVLTEPYILMYDRVIDKANDIIPILEAVVAASNAASKRPSLLIIADDVAAEALHTLIANVSKKGFSFAAIKSPASGSLKISLMEDIAASVGGKFICEEKGFSLKNIRLQDLGQAQGVIITRNSTSIFEGKGSEKAKKERSDNARIQWEEAMDPFMKDIYKKRLALLTTGVAVIAVAGVTKAEQQERKDRVDDALRATLAAIEEGIIPGGGIAFLAAISAIKYFTKDDGTNAGVAVIRESLEAVTEQILLNAGLVTEPIIKEIRQNELFGYGYNVRTNAYEDFLESGIIDPVKVAICALENAASVGGLLLTTECGITDK